MRPRSGLAMLGAALACQPVDAKGHGETSWGKAGVSLEQYARDAEQCAATAQYVTATIEPKTLRQLDALSSAQLLDTVQQLGSRAPMQVVDAISALRSADDIARRTNTFGAKYVAMVSLDVRDQLQAVLDRCLSERGYARIRLTDEQARALHRYKRHSAERTAFLHALDADEATIARQRIGSERDAAGVDARRRSAS